MKQFYCRYLLLLFVVSISACTNTQVKQTKDECLSSQSMQARFECYQSGIATQISFQMGSDYREYIHNVKTSEHHEKREVFNGVTVKIELLPNGYVKRVIFLEAGRNTFFDVMVERAIKNAGPFFLPSDSRLQKMLSEFQYTIEVE